MKKEQEKEWAKAQSIELSADLISATKNQLKFLAAVDRNRHLYDGPTLERAIYRYNAFWLPLLDKHLKNPVYEEPLMVPLDCEWIWHCHRLNPVRYKLDCEKRFGRILGNHNIISSIYGNSKSKSKEIWKKMYPNEPYELEYKKGFVGDVSLENFQSEKFTSYDLVSAVKRQAPFGYQVSRPHVSDDLFLREALARYKGFLYLIKINKKKETKHFFVPTYDVDLMWHSHQLHPISYCEDMCKLMGNVINHDDTDSDKTKGSKLDIGFSGITKMWEDTFGLRYWKAGAMNRGIPPTPITEVPYPFTHDGVKKFHALDNYDNFINFSDNKTVEILLEFLEIKNLPKSHREDLHVTFSKRQPDKFFHAKKKSLTILSETRQKQVSIFQCEPSGDLLFELACRSPSNEPLSPNSIKLFGTCSLSLQECLAPRSQFSIDTWVPVVPVSGTLNSKPILLHVSLSFTPPTPAHYVFHLRRFEPTWNDFCSFPSSSVMKVKHTKGQTCVTNEGGNDVFSLQMRDLSNNMTRKNSDFLKDVQYITDSGETHTLAEFKGNEWFIKGTNYSSTLQKSSENDGHLFEFVIGQQLVRVFAGRKLDYEPKHYEDKISDEQDFITVVGFSTENPYGRAISMIDFKHGILKVNDKWMIMTSITLAFILSEALERTEHILKKAYHEDYRPKQVNCPSTIEAQVADGDARHAKRDVHISGGYESICVQNWLSSPGKSIGESRETLLSLCEYVEYVDTTHGGKCGDCSTGGGGGNCGSSCGPIMENHCGTGGGNCTPECGPIMENHCGTGGGNCTPECGPIMEDSSLCCFNCFASGGGLMCNKAH